MASIDRMDWHYGGDFPENLPAEDGGTHIGMYLTWIIDNNLIGEMHLINSADEINKVKRREMTGRDFLIEMCDEKFWDDDLNEEGIAFTKYYYDFDSAVNYVNDYLEILGQEVESLYEVENSWENYEKLKLKLDSRFNEWKNSQ